MQVSFSLSKNATWPTFFSSQHFFFFFVIFVIVNLFICSIIIADLRRCARSKVCIFAFLDSGKIAKEKIAYAKIQNTERKTV